MIKFTKEKKRIIATYIPYENSSTDWIFDRFEQDDEVTFNKVYNFKKENLKDKLKSKKEKKIEDIFSIGKNEAIDFIFAKLEGDYYKVEKSILIEKFDVFFHKEIELIKDFFIAESDISIFKKIEQIIDEDIYILEVVIQMQFLKLILEVL
ncbi:hypothetical protein [Flavobacterium daejeonense]|uniref:hypothetical protein n=1 Tax=Flavobacterium daejeonense TaxID=350893 RepID=UPI000557B40F|nr:hypothetical protein [Flavobacterium daejeonense]